MRSRALVPLAAAAALLALAAAPPPPATAQGGAAAGERPNFLVVMTDDQTLEQFRRKHMPRTFRQVRKRATWFRQAVAAPPLCCPSRAGLMTGQYAHNHGVTDNSYMRLGDKDNILPLWLRDAGYQTAMVGKFMNNYELHGGSEPASGFERWLAFHGRPSYYGFPLSVDGDVQAFEPIRRNYATDVVTRLSRGFLNEAARDPRPFFAWVSHWAPHEESGDVGGCTGHSPKAPDRASLRAVRGERAPRTPDFNEADVSDKPRYIRSKRPLGRERIRRIDMRWRCAVAAVREVDRGIGGIVRTLKASGQWSRTIVVFLSDNGYTHGQHRLGGGKQTFFEHMIRVPMLVRVPGRFRSGRAPAASHAEVSTVDLAPTIVDYAEGASPCLDRERPETCRTMDGRSLRPILDGEAVPWREPRPIPFSLEFGCASYEALRTSRLSYLRSTARPRCGRDTEMYDLRRDRFQLENLARERSERRRRQAANRRLSTLLRCSGVAGRDARRDNRPFCR